MMFENKNKDIPRLTILIAIALLALGFWYYFTFTPPGEKNVMEVKQEVPKMLAASLGMQNNSGQIGNAVFRERNGKVLVEIDVFNAPKNVSQPVHVHEGSCPRPGGIKYALNSLVNGQSETILDVTLKDILAGLPLSVNAHKSNEDVGTYVSCGNITRESLMPEQNNTQQAPQLKPPPLPPLPPAS